MMKTYRIPFAYEKYGRFFVEAESVEDAFNKAEEMFKTMSIEEMDAYSHYVDDSESIDRDGLVLDAHGNPIEDEDDSMKTFYFTYGVDNHPFEGGWTEVFAPNKETAIAAFREKHPDKTAGMLNCAFVYSEEEFLQTGMINHGNFGVKCQEYISV